MCSYLIVPSSNFGSSKRSYSRFYVSMSVCKIAIPDWRALRLLNHFESLRRNISILTAKKCCVICNMRFLVKSYDKKTLSLWADEHIMYVLRWTSNVSTNLVVCRRMSSVLSMKQRCRPARMTDLVVQAGSVANQGHVQHAQSSLADPYTPGVTPQPG